MGNITIVFMIVVGASKLLDDLPGMVPGWRRRMCSK